MSSEERATEAVFVVVHGPTCEWGFDTASVSAIVAEAEWGGAAPLDLSPLIGAGAPGDAEPGPRRILVLSTAGGEIAVRVTGRIALRTLLRDQVQPLPACLKKGLRARALGGVALFPEQAPLLVVDPERLEREIS